MQLVKRVIQINKHTLIGQNISKCAAPSGETRKKVDDEKMGMFVGLEPVSGVMAWYWAAGKAQEVWSQP